MTTPSPLGRREFSRVGISLHRGATNVFLLTLVNIGCPTLGTPHSRVNCLLFRFYTSLKPVIQNHLVPRCWGLPESIACYSSLAERSVRRTDSTQSLKPVIPIEN